MKLAKVIGNVVSTMKHPCYKGLKILMVQPIDHLGKSDGPVVLSCDHAGAGPGEIVLLQQDGNAARELLGTKHDPFHSVIVGIVDQIDVEK
ncbi:MAG: EutN/CcmL family microcompartment protein [Oligoflexia bacterium]|nr:EutN/CcmL family microcompartment protein [Oligoflexia bacterium]